MAAFSSKGPNTITPEILKVLEMDQIMKKYQEVTTRLEQDLSSVSFDKLEISDEVKEQVKQLLERNPQEHVIATCRNPAGAAGLNELKKQVFRKAAERGHIEVVKELLPYTTKEGLCLKNRSGFDPLHIAAREGHQEIVKIFLDHEPELSKTVGQSNSTLTTAVVRGHLSIVNELLSRDSSLVDIPRSNGKKRITLCCTAGTCRHSQWSLLKKDPQLAKRTDKKGQTALHMAVKGVSCEVVKLLLEQVYY